MPHGRRSIGIRAIRSTIQHQSPAACFDAFGASHCPSFRFQEAHAQKGCLFAMHEPDPSPGLVPGGPSFRSSSHVAFQTLVSSQGGPSPTVHGIGPFNVDRLIGNATRFDRVRNRFVGRSCPSSQVRISTVHERSIASEAHTVHAGIGWRPPPPFRFRRGPRLPTGSYADACGFHHVLDTFLLLFRTDPTSDGTSKAKSHGRAPHLQRHNRRH